MAGTTNADRPAARVRLPQDVDAGAGAIAPATQAQVSPAVTLPPDVDATAIVVAAAAHAQGQAAPAVTLPPDVVARATVAPQAQAQALGLAAPAPPAAPSWAKELDYADDVGPVALPSASVEVANDVIYRIIRAVAVAHSGERLYGAVERDPGLGLLYGLVLFPQASPLLGAALRLMHARERDTFEATFGPASEELLVVTGAAQPRARLARVAGDLLDDDAWRARFVAAGDVPAFWAAQNEVAIEQQFRPLLGTALAFGLTTERALALAYDAVVARGLGGGVRWLTDVLHATGPAGPDEAVAALVAAASGAARMRLERLRDSSALSDAPAATG